MALRWVMIDINKLVPTSPVASSYQEAQLAIGPPSWLPGIKTGLSVLGWTLILKASLHPAHTVVLAALTAPSNYFGMGPVPVLMTWFCRSQRGCQWAASSPTKSPTQVLCWLRPRVSPFFLLYNLPCFPLSSRGSFICSVDVPFLTQDLLRWNSLFRTFLSFCPH